MSPLLRCLVLALLLPLAAPAAAGDLLIDNIHGSTLDGQGRLQHFEALLARDGKVVATGEATALTALAKQPERLDGQGRYLIPGLIDAHGHVMGLGFMAQAADLTGTASLADAQARIRTFAASAPGTGWLRGRGWNQVIWKLGRFPTAAELDAAVADRPAWLERVDGHAGWANSAAMQLAGITRDTRDPAGGKIERDADGNATGVLVDGAMALVEKAIPAPTPADAAKALDAALAEMARVGLTGVHDAGIDAGTFTLYRHYADAGKLTTRIYAMAGGVGTDFAAISRGGPLLGAGRDTLTVRSVKLYSDGALGSRGAAMLAPYSDDPNNRGLLFSTEAEMAKMIGSAFAKGYQVNVHAIGDRGNRTVLDAFADAYRRHPGAKAFRNRIEHAQVVALDDIPRFKSLDLIASMQPTHATSDMNMAEDRIGAERLQGAYAWRTFLAQGTVVAGGSDFPVESPNPFYGLYAAITRQDHEGRPPGGWIPAQAMSREQAFRAFTLDAAYAGFSETTQGTLEPGKWADFVLVDRDLFTVPADQIWSTKVLETWVGGKRVYRAGP
jgi:predicted amidohydrolase YtcJ